VTVDVTGGSGAVVGASTGRIEAGARSVLVRVPAKGSTGPWRIAARVSAPARTVDERAEITAPATTVVGTPAVSRATPSPRSPLRAVADFQFRRTERVHVEWTAPGALEQQSARLLDRRGQPLAVPVTVTTREAGGGTDVIADVLLASLSEGDYLIELSATRGGVTDASLVAFRVVR